MSCEEGHGHGKAMVSCGLKSEDFSSFYLPELGLPGKQQPILSLLHEIAHLLQVHSGQQYAIGFLHSLVADACDLHPLPLHLHRPSRDQDCHCHESICALVERHHLRELRQLAVFVEHQIALTRLFRQFGKFFKTVNEAEGIRIRQRTEVLLDLDRLQLFQVIFGIHYDRIGLLVGFPFDSNTQLF